MSQQTEHRLEVPGAALTYDVREPQTQSEHPPLFIFGSPMAASGFPELIDSFTDRTVITYDPRGMERSTLDEGSAVTTEIHADDLHRVVEDSRLGPVDVFASSGGAQNTLAWSVAHPEDIRTAVLHEPPLAALLEDREMLLKVNADIVETYQRRGYGPAMAKFIQLVMRQEPLPADYLDQPAPDPAEFGLPADDDGSRDDLLLSKNLAMPPYEPDSEALRASSVRIVPAIGAEGGGAVPRRGGQELAALLSIEAAVFPGDHGGFTVSEYSPNNDPAAFAEKLREVLSGLPTS